MSGSEVARIENRSYPSNTYVCTLPAGRECLVIDPGLDHEAIEAHLATHALRPVAILCSHGHFDHVGSAEPLQKKYGAKVYLHAADLKTARSSNFIMMAFKIGHTIKIPEFDVSIADGAEIDFEGMRARFVHAPGHTPGSCFIEIGAALFSGDTIYRRGLRLGQLPGEDQVQLKATLLKSWTRIPDEATVYPGHGSCGTFSAIKRENLALLSFLGLAGGVSGATSEAVRE